ncbi:hypothetical protein FA13DRAFT_1705838 [Coprinellus micaceus]|uniref:Uncharacterized protein n=1 Tax=Coprinellus micaceus TaxID=71717 RepID=A0A4Y7TQL9_COPMI|nr:hypothetical protein FA13DRAFT_1705838 [Coprinellus micaceus]
MTTPSSSIAVLGTHPRPSATDRVGQHLGVAAELTQRAREAVNVHTLAQSAHSRAHTEVVSGTAPARSQHSRNLGGSARVHPEWSRLRSLIGCRPVSVVYIE